MTPLPMRMWLARWIALLAGAAVLCAIRESRADDGVAPPDLPTQERPKIEFNRWEEDWSPLADPALRTEPLDDLKYIPLMSGDPQSYASIGLNLRERMESTQVGPFGVGDVHTSTYGLQRLELHADVRPDAHWQIFVQLQDDRAFDKGVISPVDADPLDLEQAFITYHAEVAGGQVKVRIGRQQMGFDLQRFVGARDGPNVRQSFDAVWADWESANWRVISFWSHPVQNIPDKPFDDSSSRGQQYGGFRIERNDVGPGKLSAYYSRFDQDAAQYLFAAGKERRGNLDAHYQIDRGAVDWDLEAMRQTGVVGSTSIRAWALGSVGGYTLEQVRWTPRLAVQLDLATGNRGTDNGTFNPLFPNAYYFTLLSTPTYVNLIHVRPSLDLHPTPNLKLIARLGLQWRMTTADAVYVIPNRPVPDTAGMPGRWTGVYEQVRTEWQIDRHWSAAFEGVQYQVGEVIRRAGGINTNYVGLELKFEW